jgi:conjugal transfer pilin signal peptidase TrbI
MKWFKLSLILFSCSFCIGLAFTGPFFGIRYTISPSLPYKVFISRPIRHIKRNQYVSFNHLQAEILLAKQVIGVAGDEITICNNRFYVNAQDYGLILERSTCGIPVHPITQMRIPDDCVFVYAPHEESFDSRYQEFGLIPIKQLKETLWPLF